MAISVNSVTPLRWKGTGKSVNSLVSAEGSIELFCTINNNYVTIPPMVKYFHGSVTVAMT